MNEDLNALCKVITNDDEINYSLGYQKVQKADDAFQLLLVDHIKAY